MYIVQFTWLECVLPLSGYTEYIFQKISSLHLYNQFEQHIETIYTGVKQYTAALTFNIVQHNNFCTTGNIPSVPNLTTFFVF